MKYLILCISGALVPKNLTEDELDTVLRSEGIDPPVVEGIKIRDMTVTRFQKFKAQLEAEQAKLADFINIAPEALYRGNLINLARSLKLDHIISTTSNMLSELQQMGRIVTNTLAPVETVVLDDKPEETPPVVAEDVANDVDDDASDEDS